MKALTTAGLTKLIELSKDTFLDKTDVETTTEMDVISASSIDIDSTPTEDSTNLVTSGGVYAAIQQGGGGGNVDDVKVNGTSVVVNKVANVTVPTKTSDITNDSNYQTSTQVSSAISTHNSSSSAHSDIRTDVANLKDLSNITATGKETAVGWGVPDWSAAVTMSANTIHTASSNGWVYFYQYGNLDRFFTINGTDYKLGAGNDYDHYSGSSIMVPILKNQTFKGGETVIFFPCAM